MKKITILLTLLLIIISFVSAESAMLDLSFDRCFIIPSLDRVPPDFDEEECLERSEYARDISICEDLQDLEMKDNCYYGSALWHRDGEFCEKTSRIEECKIAVEERLSESRNRGMLRIIGLFFFTLLPILILLFLTIALIVFVAKKFKSIGWKEFFKPSLEKIIIFLIVFTVLPWPREIYATPSFFTTFLFYGPVTLSEILVELIPTPYLPKLLSGRMLEMYPVFIAFILSSCLVSCFISYKTTFLKLTKIKSILSFAVLIISFVGLLIFLIGEGYSDTALGFNIIIPLFLFSIFYIIYSLIEKKIKQ